MITKSYRQAVSVKAPPEVPVEIPIRERKWRYTTSLDQTSKESFEISSRVPNKSRHSLELRTSDVAMVE